MAQPRSIDRGIDAAPQVGLLHLPDDSDRGRRGDVAGAGVEEQRKEHFTDELNVGQFRLRLRKRRDRRRFQHRIVPLLD